MAKLIMCKGLPGSGKTSWAKDMVARAITTGEDVVRVNKDEIRVRMGCSSLHGQPWNEATEREVIKTRNSMIVEALKAGATVISDDTNFAPIHEKTLRNIAKQCGVEFEINDSFVGIPIRVCIERDEARPVGERVGARVIEDMRDKYLVGVVKPIVQDESLPSALICDLDGTLARHEGKRGPYEHEKAADDDCDPAVWNMIDIYHSQGYKIIYLSGREDKYRPQTEAFLKKHMCPEGPLYMRPTGDVRNDTIVKRELFDAHVKDKYYVELCLDDRDRVVKLWRSMGLTCWQVNYGNF